MWGTRRHLPLLPRREPYLAEKFLPETRFTAMAGAVLRSSCEKLESFDWSHVFPGPQSRGPFFLRKETTNQERIFFFPPLRYPYLLIFFTLNFFFLFGCSYRAIHRSSSTFGHQYLSRSFVFFRFLLVLFSLNLQLFLVDIHLLFSRFRSKCQSVPVRNIAAFAITHMHTLPTYIHTHTYTCTAGRLGSLACSNRKNFSKP